MEKESARTGNSILAFCFGALAGAVAAFLLSPYSGAENREKLRELARGATRRVRGIPGAVREAGTAAREAFSESYEQSAKHS